MLIDRFLIWYRTDVVPPHAPPPPIITVIELSLELESVQLKVLLTFHNDLSTFLKLEHKNENCFELKIEVFI